MNAAGGCAAFAMARTSALVACVRLSRMAALRAAVQRPPAIDVPARLMTAVAPLSIGAHDESFCPGDQRTSCSRVGWRVSTTTRCPSSRNASSRAVPSRPVPPAMTTVPISGSPRSLAPV